MQLPVMQQYEGCRAVILRSQSLQCFMCRCIICTFCAIIWQFFIVRSTLEKQAVVIFKSSLFSVYAVFAALANFANFGCNPGILLVKFTWVCFLCFFKFCYQFLVNKRCTVYMLFLYRRRRLTAQIFILACGQTFLILWNYCYWPSPPALRLPNSSSSSLCPSPLPLTSSPAAKGLLSNPASHAGGFFAACWVKLCTLQQF